MFKMKFLRKSYLI